MKISQGFIVKSEVRAGRFSLWPDGCPSRYNWFRVSDCRDVFNTGNHTQFIQWCREGELQPLTTQSCTPRSGDSGIIWGDLGTSPPPRSFP